MFHAPRKELRNPRQVVDWLEDWGRRLSQPGALILIGPDGLLWHAAQRGLDTPLPENSMAVDPVTNDDAVAELAYEALIGSDFELQHGWHVNLMPQAVLRELLSGWESRSLHATYGRLRVEVPAVTDPLHPKLQRGEPRYLAHAQWAKEIGLLP